MNNINFDYKRILFIVLVVSVASVALGAQKGDSKKKPKESVQSNYFVKFDEAEYRTSPDKRIGAKIMVDPAKVGPSISSMIHLTYLPGAQVASHRHAYSSEILYVLSGFLTVKIGDQLQVAGPNSSVYIPSGAFHEYLNDSVDVVKFLQFYAPAAPEEEYRKWEKPGDSSAKEAAAEQAASKVERIVAPSMPTVPGSPRIKIGEVVKPEPSEIEKLRERLRKSLEAAKD